MISSTNDLVFVDTNILIYVRDERSAEKRETARRWLAAVSATDGAGIDLPVLNELTRWILRNEPGRSLPAVQIEIEAIAAWGTRPVDREDVELAWRVRERYGYQWFDCLLIAAAVNAGCAVFLSEDMAHGATFDGLTIINPFRASPDDVLRRN